METVTQLPDIQIDNEGSIYLFRPRTQAGREFLHSHAPHEAQWFGIALVVEHRYANDWAIMAIEEGLTVR